MPRSSASILALLAATALASCAEKAPRQLPPGPGLGNPANGAGDPFNGGAPVPGSQADFVASVTSDTVFFDTDRSNIDAADAAILRSQAQWLARYPGTRVTVEGHCDERGTRDYNLALGERRASAARTFLIGLGIAPSRIDTVSQGKERPLALGSDEASWARNRRAVTVTVQ